MEQKLKVLCTTFESNLDKYKSSGYDEANTRVDFIDKFFELLDWDVRNVEGYSEDYRDVVREDKVVIEGKPKAPDYSFRIGGVRKFFVEAKKPSVNIKEDIGPAFQVRRYAYTAKLPLSILTDFEEFAVYDTRIKPDRMDRASTARVFYCTYKEYERELDFIYNTFSKKAILKGSFDKYVNENKKKKGTSEVDKEFLKMIEEWRNDLARNLALRNLELDVYNLNNAIQLIIDRIIFLRIAEDRNMEEYGLLSSVLKNDNIYTGLDSIFKRADNKYNSGLFAVKGWISDLKIDNRVIAPIIKGLYYPDCPYELSVLPIEILGHIYEQFLGKTIRLTASHQAKVEEKPEVRKAGGVYYTPQYIVNYIVENTVGEKIKKKKPEIIADLKILDPACGSGSFLVGAFSYLLNYHLQYYTKEKNIKKALKNSNIFQVTDNTYQLSIHEKQKILLNNIYGVDIDRQAVEVTKLSLLLKLMEGEQIEAIGRLFKHSDLKLLPDLSNNIKCGNSLIGSDFYEDKNLELFGKEEMRKVNVFDWDEEFPEVFGTSPRPSPKGRGSSCRGFDCVIGNPPYVRYENLDANLINYATGKFKCSEIYFDIYQLFLEKSYYLINDVGLLGFIFPNLFLKGMNYKVSRKFFYENTTIKIIRNYGDGVFDNVQMPTTIMILSKLKKKNNNIDYYLKNDNVFKKIIISQEHFNNDNYIYNYDSVCSKIDSSNKQLSDLIKITRGLEIGKNTIISKKNESIEILFGENIYRYKIKNYSYIDKKIYEKFKKDGSIFEGEKIAIRETGSNITAIYDESGSITNRSLYCIKSDLINLKYLLGIINSCLIQYYYKNQFKSNTDIFPKIRIGQVKKLPIKILDKNKSDEKILHDKMISLVDQMLSAQKELYSSESESDKKLYQQKIDLLDKQIDQLVYELYGLTDEEIRIVEGE